MNRSLQRFSLKSLYNGLGIFIFIFSQWAYAQCPTVTNASQSFCNTESPTIANLNAINNGGGVAWFSSTTSTTPLSSGAGLVNGATYYADNAAGNCGTRQPVTVTIYAAPTGQNFQGVCVDNPLEATIANLIANGNNIRWYTTPSGGTTLPTTTVLTDNTIYYASQTNPDTGCETSRLAVFVNVGVVPVPTGPAIQSFCLLPGNTPTVANLQASGLNNWYATVSSVVVLDPATPLINGETYYATTVDPPCESVNRLEITVQLLPPTDAGTDGTLALCSNALTVNPNRNLFSILGGSPQTTGTWSGPLPTSNGHLGIVNISTLTAAGSPHVFTYTVTNAACPPDTATVTITVSNPVNAGNDATLTVCSNNPSVNLFPLLGTTAQAGGIWSPPLASGTGVFNPAVDPSGTYTYTVTGPNACGNDTAIVTVTVKTAANAGTSANTTVCALGPSVNLFTILGGTPQSGGVWSPTLASGTGVFNPLVDAPGTYTYTVTGIPPCTNSSANVTVALTPGITPVFTQRPPICQGATLTALSTTSNNGITGTWSPALNNTATTTYTFTPTAGQCATTATMTITVNPNIVPTFTQVAPICQGATLAALPTTSNNGLTGTWTPALASGTGLFNPAVDTAGTYTYTVVGGAPCGSDTATVSVSITPAPNAGTDGVATFCADSAPADLFTFLGGTPQAGGTWTPALASGTGVFNPAVDTAGVYTYTVTGNAPCANGTASATVTVNPIPNAGNDGTLVLCSNATPTDLFLSLGGTPQAGGTWTPALASGTGFFNPAVDTAGTYTYTVVGGAPCGSDTATVNVSITPAPNAGTDVVATFCADSAPADLFTFLGGTPQVGGTWTPALASGSGVFNPAVDTAGVYTYTVTGTAPCANGTASATVTVNPLPNAGNDGTLVLCSNATPTDLFLSLGGIPQAGGTWTPALASGTGFFNPAVDTAGTYTYTVVGGAPCGSDTSTVSVTLTPGPNAGVDATVTLCSNATPIDLFLSLGSSAQSGGTWSPPLASGTGIFNPAFDPAGTYIYTVPGTGTCNPDTATLTVNLIAPPDFGLGIITAPNICQNSAVIVAISGATTLADGNYTFTYSVTNASPSTGTTATVAITAGNGQFTIPASYFQTSGNVTIALTAVTALNGNCTSTISTASTTITVLPQPTLSNATVLVASLCLGEQATVTITGATGLTNGNYTLDYQLSGANTGTFSSSVIFTNGAASFTIPTSDLANAGTVNITLTSIISQITTCGNSTLNFTPITFEVQDPQPPVLTGSTTFCNDSNATLTDLSAQLSGSGTIVWYSSASGGTPLDPTTVVQDGITYYGAVQSSAGCESTRLELTVVLESCTPDDIIIPDGFSPNTDGVNDEFIIKNLLELYPNFTLEIFNRYGNVLFKGNRSNPHWNGRSTEGSVGAGLAPAGVYFFILEFNDGVRAPIQGRLYLSR
ncbi:MAG: gliding motility-associated C-terminal domain-containing protein [Flavobacterium sp.]